MEKLTNKKVIILLILLAVVVSCFVIGTSAWFTSGAESQSYTISGAEGHKANLDLNAEDATCNKESVSFYENEAVIGLPDPKRSGYAFLGWFTEKEGGNKVTKDYKMPNDDITLYAHWDINHFAEDSWSLIKENVTNGTAQSKYVVGSEKEIKIGDQTYTLRLVNNSEPNGFIIEFVDLFKIEKFGSTSSYDEITERLKQIFESLPEDLKSVISDSTFDSITQKLHIVSENQIFNTEGYIEGTPNDKNYLTGDKIGELPVLTRDGYKFLGWFTEKDGGVQVTADTVITENMTLYPHWEKIEENKEGTE